MLKEKDKAPIGVIISGEKEAPVSLKDYSGRYIVLYFYPKDNTPGCTVEAKNFRDWNDKVQKLGVEIIGVSKDSIKSHEKFCDKYGLNFILWSDPNHKLMEAFGTWQRKKFMGREYMGTTRSTFVIDPKGKIVKVWENVTPKDHAKEVYEFLKNEIKK